MNRLSLAVFALTSLFASACHVRAEACPEARTPSPRVVVVRARPAHVLGRARPVVVNTNTNTNTNTNPNPNPNPNANANADAFARHNLERINAYRAQGGLAPLVLDADLSAFAREGTEQNLRDHVAHGHFGQAGRAICSKGWCAENQAWSSGGNEERQIDGALEGMMKEGPSGGHYANIMAPQAKRLGVGLFEDEKGNFTLTNDFSS